MKDKIKELRVWTDGLMQLVLTLSGEDKVLPKLNLEYSTKSRSIIKCHDSLELAKAWLGKCLAELGDINLNPYSLKVEVIQEWFETSEIKTGWGTYGWMNLDGTQIDFEGIISTTDYDKFGNPIKGYYIKEHKTKDDTEPTTDVKKNVEIWADLHFITDDPIICYSKISHIEKVDWLKQEIEKVIKGVKNISTSIVVLNGIGAGQPTNQNLSREFAIARTNTYNHLCEAKFHLGFELQRIKQTK
jgi:hypothetical protein